MTRHIVLQYGRGLSPAITGGADIVLHDSSPNLSQRAERKANGESRKPSKKQVNSRSRLQALHEVPPRRHGYTHKDRPLPDLTRTRSQEHRAKRLAAKEAESPKVPTSDEGWIKFLSEKYDLKPLFKPPGPKHLRRFSGPDYHHALSANVLHDNQNFKTLIENFEKFGEFQAGEKLELEHLYRLGFILPAKHKDALGYQQRLDQCRKSTFFTRGEKSARELYWILGGKDQEPSVSKMKGLFQDVDFKFPEIFTKDRKSGEAKLGGGTVYKSLANKASSRKIEEQWKNRRRDGFSEPNKGGALYPKPGSDRPRYIVGSKRYSTEEAATERKKGNLVDSGDSKFVRRTKRSNFRRSALLAQDQRFAREQNQDNGSDSNLKPSTGSMRSRYISDEAWVAIFQNLGLEAKFTKGNKSDEEMLLLKGLQKLLVELKNSNDYRLVQIVGNIAESFVTRGWMVDPPRDTGIEVTVESKFQITMRKGWYYQVPFNQLCSGQVDLSKRQIEFLQAAYKLGYIEIPDSEETQDLAKEARTLKGGLNHSQPIDLVRAPFNQATNN